MESNTTLNTTLKQMYSELHQSGKFMLVNAYVSQKYGARNFSIFASPANADKQAQVEVAILLRKALDGGDWSAFEAVATVPAGQAGETPAPASVPNVTVIPVGAYVPTEAKPTATTPKDEEEPEPHAVAEAPQSPAENLPRATKKKEKETPAKNVIQMPPQKPAEASGAKDPMLTLAEVMIDLMKQRGLVRLNKEGQIEALGPDDERLRRVVEQAVFREVRHAVRSQLAKVLSSVAKELSDMEETHTATVSARIGTAANQ